ncbi:conserved hypothetical protein [Cyanobium sp. PCC 7001]|uniref:hypothetical protein n=1 Tax=Cyanobium sp. PCC 7001 TaxID=180281 RepID=UPI0001805438|nr:hypothetical protein [Cyanobium sp. PCC 7001]EDY39128.1 conserved hypothetical protein [Cyanobium sp. PCC 7001]
MAPIREPAGSSSQVFNNADSFAQAFDEAWKQLSRTGRSPELDREASLAAVLEQLADHPFRRSSPELAEQVAQFRLRLLGL